MLRALAVTAIALATMGRSHSACATEIEIFVTGTFKAPTAGQMAHLPAGMPYSRADLVSGTWSLAVRYEDSILDADPDPFVGRYFGAIRRMRLTVGSTTTDLPTGDAQFVVRDGGLGAPNRESIQLEAVVTQPFGVMRVSWIQLNQSPNRRDLRGNPGSLTTDELPEPTKVANLVTSSSFDRFLLLRIGQADADPLLYLSSSKVAARAEPATR